MNKPLLYFFGLTALASCSTAGESATSTRPNRTPVAYNTVVECTLYDGMNKQSTQLMTIGSGMEVQVMDTVDAYFVKARVTKDGKPLTGYMYRTCFPQR
ncbi:hypothetical protein [Hymenobacter cellulosivorans]|uniref:SH3 domain-containing protein n=1 Tax=Hymenobacter cellulosivorans TaxID=2932249 RepID=A0ABY4FAN3_9BACT|nr:hypothetical protein [Hymenobacter cellulosivorans]UOQ53737.1 hypothetical protein MUN80_03010 [Hymenobacter cellulosivorans]